MKAVPAPQTPPAIKSLLLRLLTTRYTPDPSPDLFLARPHEQETPGARVQVGVPDGAEAARFFGVPMFQRGVQPVYLRIANNSTAALRLHVVSLDPAYFTPLEAAAANHFSFLRRLTAFGAIAWLFVPLLLLAPAKLITAFRANHRMDDLFQRHAFRLRPISPGGTAEGFVFTRLDVGTKEVRVRLLRAGGVLIPATTTGPPDPARAPAAPAASPDDAAVNLVFSIPVAGIAADHHRRDLVAPADTEPCTIPALVEHLRALPPATTNRRGTGTGDPVNLAIVGDIQTVLGAFAARWDETETITAATCWRTVRAFLLGTEYRYSPVSPLYLKGRSQDVALQRIRRSINERLHLRLWRVPLRVEDKPVWIGQVSRDIGVRFTTKAWNLTTHRIDPDVDESRDYVLEDLLEAHRVEAAGYVDGVGACNRASPRRNLCGDPYFTDGKRVVVLLSNEKVNPRFIAWS